MFFRRGLGLACLGDTAIYAVGGLDDKNCFDTVERYDPVANTWTQVASLNLPRGGVGVAVLKVIKEIAFIFRGNLCVLGRFASYLNGTVPEGKNLTLLNYLSGRRDYETRIITSCLLK